ncbi:MAG: tol-pal system protein YbgF [Desulfovibrio sp.]|nr:tol-pal system protein YbgF [Desulfovibrio sp.]
MRFSMLCSLLCAALTAGCVSGGSGGGSLSARVDQHEQQIRTLMSQVGQVEQVLPGQAEMWSQMQSMRQELNMLAGKVDDAQGGGSGEQPSLRDRVARLEAVVRQMASQLAVNVDGLNTSESAAPAPHRPVSGAYPPPAAYPGAASPAPGRVDTASALYDAGIKSFDQRRYKEAASSFKDFYASYPTHKLAGNAHFWEGESWFQLKDYARAALAYQEVIAKFPGSPKLQSAMLKQGIALQNAGKKQAARERLNELVKRYPTSPEATRAKQVLAENK